MSEVLRLDCPERPMEVALIDALTRAIDELGRRNMTLAEIIGCLETVKLDMYNEVRETWETFDE